MSLVCMHFFFHYSAKVMLIHAGGYSQRLPNLSVLGKIFLTLPCGMYISFTKMPVYMSWNEMYLSPAYIYIRIKREM